MQVTVSQADSETGHDTDTVIALRTYLSDSGPRLGFGSCGGDLQSMTCIYVCHAYIDHLGIDGSTSCFVQA